MNLNITKTKFLKSGVGSWEAQDWWRSAEATAEDRSGREGMS